jgi:hypothetical protein
MSDIAIRVENLSKQYRIGGPQERYKTLRDTLTGAFTAPFRRLSSVVRGQPSVASNEAIWALKDVSFEACPEPVEGSNRAKSWASLRLCSGQALRLCSGQALRPSSGQALRLCSGQALRLCSGQALRLCSGQALRQAQDRPFDSAQDRLTATPGAGDPAGG